MKHISIYLKKSQTNGKCVFYQGRLLQHLVCSLTLGEFFPLDHKMSERQRFA